MKISVIVPSNNASEINGFLRSFDTLNNFKNLCEVIIIGNGDVHYDSILGGHSVHYSVKRIDEDYTNKLIPFAKLRGEGMKESNADFFLFLDDDNRFNAGSENFYLNCINFLNNNPNCHILQADRKKVGKSGMHIKKDGFFWTGYGLFLKNINLDFKSIFNLYGACEDLLYSYEILDKGGIPYIAYGNPTTRDISLPNDHKQHNNISYSKDTLESNIIGYIKEKFDKDGSWDFYSNIKNLEFPSILKEKIENRIKNEF